MARHKIPMTLSEDSIKNAIQELEEYKKHSPKYRRINQKPGKTRRFCQNIRRKALYGWFYLKKIERAVIRRMKRQNGTADA